jgi:hypothetical protein
MWEQRNDIKHNTLLHPRKAQALEAIKHRVSELYAKGSQGLLARDRPLLQKALSKIHTGSAEVQEQWYPSVLLAHRRAASAKENRLASLRVERQLMETWLGIALPEDKGASDEG